MHIWHHSKKIPNKYGVNFGISLSLWDYIFKPTTHLVMEEISNLVLTMKMSFKDLLKQKSIPLKNNLFFCQERLVSLFIII
jgi:sterol desaturase/sphingolipid hydroxylase (fatty acid hydroxylase superfamily)